MPASDGPFGTAPNIGIGFSDAALLTFSFAGFGFLVYSVYTVILLRLKNRAELEHDDPDYANEKKYEQVLAESDVAKLSRAQRRARARHIMKQQRRVGTTEQQPVQENDGALVAQNQHPGDNNEADADEQHNQHHHHHHLSRKERQRLAKAAERQERTLLQEQRRAQQDEAQKRAHAQKVRRIQQESQQAQAEKLAARVAQQNAWETFIKTETRKLLVTDWLNQCQQDRVVSCKALATEFGVSPQQVRQRIQQLVQEQRVAGVFYTNNNNNNNKDDDDDDNNMFIFFDNKQLQLLADTVLAKGCMDASQIAAWMNHQVSQNVAAQLGPK